MKTAVVAVLGALVCISLAAFPAQAAPTTFKDAQFSHPLTIDNPYFPLTAGTTMIYNGTSEGNPTHEELVVTHDTELVAGIQARVAPELVTVSDPLYGMEDSTTGVAFRTDVLGDYSIIESERPDMVAGPEPTAYGLFADFVNAVKR